MRFSSNTLRLLLVLDVLASIVVVVWIAVLLLDFNRQPVTVQGEVESQYVLGRRPRTYLVVASPAERTTIRVTEQAAGAVGIGDTVQVQITPWLGSWVSVHNPRTGVTISAAKNYPVWLVGLAVAFVPLVRRNHWRRFDWGAVVTIACCVKVFFLGTMPSIR